MSDNDRKALEVSTLDGTEHFAVGQWSNYYNDAGALVVLRDDGSRRTYAPGYWQSTNTEFGN